MVQDLINAEARKDLEAKLHRVKAMLLGQYDPKTQADRIEEAIKTFISFQMYDTIIEGKRFSQIVCELIDEERRQQDKAFIDKYTKQFYNKVMSKPEPE